MAYGIFHAYDVDGGFGDVIVKVDLVCICRDEETAKRFIERYRNPHVYDKPYSDLECGDLYYEKLGPELTEENMDRFEWKKSDYSWVPDTLEYKED